MSSTKLFTTRHSRINRRRTSILMLRSVFKSGRVKARMLSQLFWSSKITRRKWCDHSDDSSKTENMDKLELENLNNEKLLFDIYTTFYFLVSINLFHLL